MKSKFVTSLAVGIALVLIMAVPRTARAVSYAIDDGTAEDSIGLNAGGTFMALNSFAVTGGNNIINSISIAWGTPVIP